MEKRGCHTGYPRQDPRNEYDYQTEDGTPNYNPGYERQRMKL
jgi:hypothetical protein